MRQAVNISGHVAANDQTFFLADEISECRVVTGEAPVQFGEFVLVIAIAEQLIDEVGEFVTGGAAHQPVIRQVLAHIQNLLDDHLNFSEVLPDTPEIHRRIVESIDVVDSQPGDLAFANQLEDQPMTKLKYVRILYPQ